MTCSLSTLRIQGSIAQPNLLAKEGMFPRSVLLFFVFQLILWASTSPAAAITANDIIVVYNKNMPASLEVAKHYLQKREVPEDNLLGIALPQDENMSRTDYDELLVPPLRERAQAFLSQDRHPVFLLVYGIPLKVSGIEPSASLDMAHRQGEKEALQLAGIVRELSLRLLNITDPVNHAPASPEGRSTDEILRGSQELAATAMTRTAAWEKKRKKNNPDASSLIDEAASIVFRLAGMSRLAESTLKSGRAALAAWATANENITIAWGVALERRLSLLSFQGITPQTLFEDATLVRAGRGLVGELQFWNEARKEDFVAESSSAVDSELALVLMPNYALAKWLPNPHLITYDKFPGIEGARSRTVFTARLDGPSPAIAKRLVDDAVSVEAQGLYGVFYLDARWPTTEHSASDEYKKFDGYLHNLYKTITDSATMETVLDTRQELFAPPCCPNAALYCGWYSLAQYKEGLEWKRGAVGYHVASGEASTLRSPTSTVWCKKMLEAGVAATLGPVQEPYLHSFPRPDHFFPLLMTGKLSLVEVYFRTTPFLSWRQVLIGDPLYTPFKNGKKNHIEDVMK